MASGQLTYLTSPDCGLCVEGRTLLERLAAEFDLVVIELPWDSPSGRALVDGSGAFFPPALFLEGSLLGYGRLSERRLRRRLASVPA
jgi:hypothetical protein